MDIFIAPLKAHDADLMFPGLLDARGYEFIPDNPPENINALRERYIKLAAGRPKSSNEIWLNWIIWQLHTPLDYTPLGYI